MLTFCRANYFEFQQSSPINFPENLQFSPEKISHWITETQGEKTTQNTVKYK
jgi:hypothetical protein